MELPFDEKLRRLLNGPEEGRPMGRAVALLLEDAIDAGASDVHLHPMIDGLDVFYRLDGVLHLKTRIEPAHAEHFLGKVKVIAGLLTYRRDIPQDGQIPACEVGGKTDIRVSLFPTIHGEKAVLRLFLYGREKFSLAELGFPDAIRLRLRAAVARPDGVILLTGPSGSGKTTTIYALLHEIVRPGAEATRHVVTIEDPVEHVIPGITQTQVNLPLGLTFGNSLRSLLRQDPQVIMVGEIRDPETAHVAMEAGLTGHLVISTVHTGTSSGVVARLLDMGVEPNVLTSSLSCVLAQRLVRRLCPDCRDGCAACRGSGFRGRCVLAELLETSDPVREAIAARRTRDEIERIAVAQGMTSIREAGERLMAEGRTTKAELARVIG